MANSVDRVLDSGQKVTCLCPHGCLLTDEQHVQDVEFMVGLDAGIRKYVCILHAHGVETYESCEGGEGHSYPEPTIRFHGQVGAGFQAYAIAKDHDLPLYQLRRSYSIQDGELVGPYWEMVFSRKES